VQMWDGDEGLAATFEDIGALSAHCRFSDCEHRTEPGCAIRAALESGSLSGERYEHFQKLQREIAFQQRRANASAAALERDRWKKIHHEQRAREKFRRETGER
ncbi:MAG TPA: ribosome small subunit-dependent GTPase, partial [Planctomycetota bacterium]|nr:ribosome small subunit-dependent GTPase [Planctomycetota bacterium]